MLVHATARCCPIVLRAVAEALGLERRTRTPRLDPRLKPGAAIVLHRDAPRAAVVAIDRLDA